MAGSSAIFLAIGLGCGSYFFLKPYFLRAEAHDLRGLEDFNVTTVFYDRGGEEIGRLFVEDRILLKHDEIPERMRQATLAVEDKRFFLHPGIDGKGVLRAIYINLKTGKRMEGASTITQQLAKHLHGHFEKTLDRKLVEAFLALRIEQHYTKDQILDFYLNRIYFGKGSFGLAAAAGNYFGKKAKDLTVAECALLAGIIKAPNSSSPRHDRAAALRRRDRVIALMASQKILTAEEAATALREPLQLIPERMTVRHQSYFMALALKELREVLKVEEWDDIPQGLTVKTTLDAGLQRVAELQVANRLREVSARAASPKPGGEPGKNELQAAALILDLKSAAVRVLIGGRDFRASSFDRVRMARRENGALLQPFLYALAFERLHFHPASMINASFLDEEGQQEEIGFGDPKRDLGKRYLMIQDALTLSNKACAARVGLQVGIRQFIEWLVSAGVERLKQNEGRNSWDLEPLTLSEITSLYQMLGNEGRQQTPYAIESVANSHGETLYQAPPQTGTPLLDPLVARQMTLTLQSVVRDGTASLLIQDYSFSAPVAGMTGYSEGYRDAWFVGYTPSLAAGVWVGFDQSIPIGSKFTATKSALPVWGDMMQKILENDPQGAGFPVPRSLSKVEVARRSGVIQGMGFLNPGAGHVFVYLRQDQLNQVKSGSASTQIQQPKDWADWLSTMFASPTGDTPATVPFEESDDAATEIPLVATYRMPALRGNILSADGEVLAAMAQSKSLVLGWPAQEVAHDEEEAIAWVRSRLEGARDWLKTDIDITDADLRLLYRFRRFHPVTVAENLNPAQVEAFAQTPLSASGFSLQGVPRRVYPLGDSLAHVVGYLQRKQGINRKHYQAEEVIYDDYQGAAGLEERFDQELRGQEGQLTIATTPEGFAQAVVVNKKATAGAQLRLTIDLRIQQAIERAFQDIPTGAAVVMDVRNGDILGMISRPTFDPNSFMPKLSADKWKALVEAAQNPLLDRVYRQQNPPGSIFKIVTALASVRAGVFDPQRLVSCPGFFAVGNMRYELPREKGSPVAFLSAIARSYNTYFFDLGLRTGRENLIQMSQELGLGRSTEFILPGELAGLIPTPDFVRATHQRSMGAGDVANMSIGQGDVLTTPLQMARMMCAVANGGTLYRPRLAKQLEDSEGKIVQTFPNEIVRRIAFPDAEKKILIEGLVAVTEEGTAIQAQVPGIKVAAKTGTAQVGSKARPRQIAWIVGFLPADEPQYAFVIMIEGNFDQDLHGGEDAGPLVGKLFSEIFTPSSATLISGKKE
jgi:penicillin-binding protein 2